MAAGFAGAVEPVLALARRGAIERAGPGGGRRGPGPRAGRRAGRSRPVLPEGVEAQRGAGPLAAHRRSLEFNPATRLRTGDGGSSGRSAPSNGLKPFRRPLAGLGERSKAVSEALRTVAKAWANWRRSGPGRQRASWGLAACAGRARRRGLMGEAAGLDLAGPSDRGSLEQAKGAQRQRLKGRAGASRGR
jgi:hypothetical protein